MGVEALKDVAEVMSAAGGWGIAALMWWEKKNLQTRLEETQKQILELTEKLIAAMTEFNIKTRSKGDG